MSVQSARKLAQMPSYKAGVPKGRAPEAIRSENIAQLASNESPFAPHPAVQEVIARTASSMNRYPDPGATLLRRRLADRFETEPGNVVVGNGSCEILLAGAAALCEPGSEIIFGWPAFSIYPHLAALTGAREIRVPLTDSYHHDLDAMLAEVTAATQLLIVCNPNNPTGTYLDAEAIGDFCDRVPGHVTVIVDEAYIEFQSIDDHDATVDLVSRLPNLVLLRTFSKCYGLAGLRVGYGLGSSKFRAAADAVRQPFCVNAIAQAAASEAVLHSDDVASRVEKTMIERGHVEGGLEELGLETADSQANFSWVSLGDADEGAVVSGLEAEGIYVRPGTALGGTGHVRVTHGTRTENDRFLTRLSELVVPAVSAAAPPSA